MLDADSFSLQFPPGCTTEAKACLLGAVFLIDFMFFEQPAEAAGGGGGFDGDYGD